MRNLVYNYKNKNFVDNNKIKYKQIIDEKYRNISYQHYPHFQNNNYIKERYVNNKYISNNSLMYNNNILNNRQCLVPIFDKTENFNYQYNKTKDIDQCGVILLNGSFNYPQVLLIFQKESQKWGLPKGHLNIEEKNLKNYYFCAKRELFEETGILINTSKHKKYGTILLNNKLFYVIHILKDFVYINPVDKEEISGYTWCSILKLDLFIKHNQCNRTIKDLEHLMVNVKK